MVPSKYFLCHHMIWPQGIITLLTTCIPFCQTLLCFSVILTLTTFTLFRKVEAIVLPEVRLVLVHRTEYHHELVISINGKNDLRCIGWSKGTRIYFPLWLDALTYHIQTIIQPPSLPLLSSFSLSLSYLSSEKHNFGTLHSSRSAWCSIIVAFSSIYFWSSG